MAVDQMALVLGFAKFVGLPIAKKYALEYVKHLLDPNTEKWKESHREAMDEFVIGVVQQVNELATELAALREAVGPSIDEQAAARAEDPQVRWMYANYAMQAAQEPLDERRLMLQYLTAGILDVRLTIAQHARVQRRIHELDTSDVLTLYGLSRTYGHVYKRRSFGNERIMRAELLRDNGGGDALIASGCVRLFVPQHDGVFIGSGSKEVPEQLEITEFGRLLLRVLRAYCRARAAPFDIPGRECLDGERNECEIEAAFPQFTALREALRPLAIGRPETASRYMAPNWSVTSVTDATPPLARAAARLDVEQLSTEQADRLRQAAPLVGGEPPFPGAESDSLGVIAFPQADGTTTARVWGPHDVLRRIVEEFDIRWF